MVLRKWALFAATTCVLGAACTPVASSDGSGAGGDDPSGGGGSGGSGGDAGSAGSGGSGGTSTGAALPVGTLLYVRSLTSQSDALVARDLPSGNEHVVTDLTGDGSSGWNIDGGYSISPDRHRIALSSLYGPTKEDNATGLATKRIWTFAVDGTDFRRLTPPFPNTGGGKSGFSIDVTDPTWTADGSAIVYDYGEYWWEGTDLRGGSFPWTVSTAEGSYPSLLTTSTDCSVIHSSRNPATGELLFIHSVCIPGQSEDGLYLYPAAGGNAPTRLVGRATDGIDVYLATPSWLPDGSGFVFLGSTEATSWTPAIIAYDMAKLHATPLFAPPSGSHFRSVAISPDGSKIVYCLADDTTNARDLHVIDLAPATPTDTALTNDGKSCDPSF